MDFSISLDILKEIMALIIPSTFLWALVTKGFSMIVRAASGRRFLDE